MKGRISPRLDAVLRDPQAREQLKVRLLRGEDGRIVSGDKAYLLKMDVTKPKPK